MAFDFLHTWERNAARVAEVLGVLFRYGLADWLKDVPLPRDLGDVPARIRRGEINVRLEHHRLDRTINRVIAGLLTAALVLASSLLWAMKAPPTYRGVSIVGFLGYLTAAWLGWRTLHAIHKSGDLRNRDGGDGRD